MKKKAIKSIKLEITQISQMVHAPNSSLFAYIWLQLTKY